MARIADVQADIVQQRGVFEPLALAVGQPMHGPSLIEQRQGEPGDLLGVFGKVVTALGQLDDASPADVRVAVHLGDLLAVALDVVEHQTLAQRQIAQREFRRPESAHDRVEQDGARDGEVGPARLEPRHPQPLLQAEPGQRRPDLAQLL